MDNKIRVRSTNLLPSERAILLELVYKYHSIIENKKTDKVNATQKKECWNMLAAEFNACSSLVHRSPDFLKTGWENMKRKSKKRFAETKKETFKTGM